MCAPCASSSSSRVRCADMKAVKFACFFVHFQEGRTDVNRVSRCSRLFGAYSKVSLVIYLGLRLTWQFVVTRLLAQPFKDIRYPLFLVGCLHDSIPRLVSFGGDMRRWFSNAPRHAREGMETACRDGRRDPAYARSPVERLAHSEGVMKRW
jgi:hypothetical protein